MRDVYKRQIPNHIQIFIISSNQLILIEAAKLKTKYKNLNVLEKEDVYKRQSRESYFIDF